jgi:hypothetical protein
MIHRHRLTANLEGGFVVFIIGMRINRPGDGAFTGVAGVQ